MTSQTLWQKIRSHYYAMNDSERRIADLILEQKEVFLKMTAQEISDLAGGSKSSVSRFCQKLGFEGLVSMKEAVLLQMEGDKATNFTPYAGSDRRLEAENYLSAIYDVMRETGERLDIPRLSRVAEMAAQAKRIFIFAAGPFIGGLAERFAAHLLSLGYAAFSFTESFSARIASLALCDKDLVIAISFRGRTVSVVDAANAARSAGAKTVCITCTPSSPISKVSEECILVENEESRYPTEACATFYSLSLVLDLLYVFMTSLRKEEASLRLRKLQGFLEAERYPRKPSGKADSR